MRDYWTKDKCKSESFKYATRTAFFKGQSYAYNIAREMGWLDEICKHMANKAITTK
jgi:putative lipase involved disintegration of autophagic bodies